MLTPHVAMLPLKRSVRCQQGWAEWARMPNPLPSPLRTSQMRPPLFAPSWTQVPARATAPLALSPPWAPRARPSPPATWTRSPLPTALSRETLGLSRCQPSLSPTQCPPALSASAGERESSVLRAIGGSASTNAVEDAMLSHRRDSLKLEDQRFKNSPQCHRPVTLRSWPTRPQSFLVSALPLRTLPRLGGPQWGRVACLRRP
jgi:hypothetical protein